MRVQILRISQIRDQSLRKKRKNSSHLSNARYAIWTQSPWGRPQYVTVRSRIQWSRITTRNCKAKNTTMGSRIDPSAITKRICGQFLHSSSYSSLRFLSSKLTQFTNLHFCCIILLKAINPTAFEHHTTFLTEKLSNLLIYKKYNFFVIYIQRITST